MKVVYLLTKLFSILRNPTMLFVCPKYQPHINNILALQNTLKGRD